jgi:hypothetical protein
MKVLAFGEAALLRGLDRERRDHPLAGKLRHVPPAIFAGFEQRLRRNGVGPAEIEHRRHDGETIDLVARDTEPAHGACRDAGGIDEKIRRDARARAVFAVEGQGVDAIAVLGLAQAEPAHQHAAARRDSGQHRVERRAVEVPARP